MFQKHFTAKRSLRASLDGQVAEGVTIRTATAGDAQAVERVAALDSQTSPEGGLVLAEVRGEVVAALPIDGGRPVADPFRPTADLMPLLELRALQLRGSISNSAVDAPSAAWEPRLAR